jgi:CelD/BcsL family acetyltransferase involved in cellulose biosynthesis
MIPLSTNIDTTPPRTDEWDRLCDRVGASPFVRPSWMLPWYEAFDRSRGACFVTASTEGGELVGVLALVRRFGSLFSATNWHSPIYSAVARDAEVGRALLNAAMHAAPALVLRFVTAESQTATSFAAVGESSRLSLHSRRLLESPRVEIQEPWDTYEKGLSKSMLKTLRRRSRRLEELGEIEIEVVTDSKRGEARLREGLELERAGWKGRNGTAIAVDPRVARFYGQVVASAAESSRLSLAFLRLNGRAIAFHLDLVDDGVLYGLKGTYAEDLGQFSPSRILRHERIKQAFADGVGRYEFLGADEPYKADWANATTELEVFQAYQRSATGRVAELAGTHGRQVALRLRAARARVLARRSRRGEQALPAENDH